METSNEDLEAFVLSAINKGFIDRFRKNCQIVDLKITRFKNLALNTEEVHGLVRIEPDSSALRIIKRLNRKPILGKRINVRQFHNRAWQNDSRSTTKNHTHGNRRKNDRRRSTLVETKQKYAIHTNGLKEFHKTH